MGKILITLKVPSVEQKFDVLVPDFLPVKDVIPLMAEAVSELTRMMYVSSGAEVRNIQRRIYAEGLRGGGR